MKTDVLRAEVIDKIAVVTLGSPKKMYFDMAMGDALTEELQALAGDPDVRVVIITGGTPGYFNRHFDIVENSNFAISVSQFELRG